MTNRAEHLLPPFEEIREGVLQRWREGESERIFTEMVARLKADYEVEIDEESLMRFDYLPDGAARERTRGALQSRRRKR